MYEELQVVKATKNLSDKVKIGCIGTILYVYFEEKSGYEVEFVNADYETLDILTVGETDIEIVNDSWHLYTHEEYETLRTDEKY